MNDRALRSTVCSLGSVGNGYPRQDGFDIVVASEIMSIFFVDAVDDEEEQIEIYKKKVLDIIFK